MSRTTLKSLDETIGFDHPLYCLFFGAGVGAASTGVFRLPRGLGDSSYQYIQVGISFFLVATGVFWLLRRPVAARYGGKSMVVDSVLGLLVP